MNATTTVQRDSHGLYIRIDAMTFRPQPIPFSNTVLRGGIRAGAITISEKTARRLKGETDFREGDIVSFNPEDGLLGICQMHARGITER